MLSLDLGNILMENKSPEHVKPFILKSEEATIKMLASWVHHVSTYVCVLKLFHFSLLCALEHLNFRFQRKLQFCKNKNFSPAFDELFLSQETRNKCKIPNFLFSLNVGQLSSQQAFRRSVRKSEEFAIISGITG